ncbi:MAG: hypothetical protein IPM79_38950 [Polyangiaceae bacterium]|jgi:hypothetical protein|nr:hypothetical protein [Polyangiaceae bacterium]MBK8943422.1 hypothetical protein [Polyangiaceae bacterium]
MYRTTLLAVGLLVSLATVGCKSDIEKYADDICACSDKKCVDEVQAKWKDKMKDDKGGEKKLEDLKPEEKAAFEKMMKCSIEIFEKESKKK